MRDVICIETPYTIGAHFSAVDLARRVSDAFDVLRANQTPENSGSPSDGEAHYGSEPNDIISPALSIAEAWDQPLSIGAFLDEIGFNPTRPEKYGTGFSFWGIRDSAKPRRSKRNLDKECRSRGRLREACRHDPSQFDRLVTEDVAQHLILNREEIACEALDLITQPESDPELEDLRIATIRAGQKGNPLPLAYFEVRAKRLSAGGYQPTRPRTPSRLPGVVIGAHAACAEHDLALDELDKAIADGSAPIVRRGDIIIALRKSEAERTKFSEPAKRPRPNKPTPNKARHLTLVVDNTTPAVVTDGEELLAA